MSASPATERRRGSKESAVKKYIVDTQRYGAGEASTPLSIAETSGTKAAEGPHSVEQARTVVKAGATARSACSETSVATVARAAPAAGRRGRRRP